MVSFIRKPSRALALTMGVCVVGAMLAHLTLSDDPSPPPPTSREPATLVASKAVERAPAQEPSPRPAAQSDDAVPTQLPFQLLGTMMSDDPAMSLAIVYEGTTRHSRSVWRGSTLQGAKVLAIERTRLWLSNQGRVEFVELSPGSAEPQAAAAPSAVVAPGPAPAVVATGFGATLQQTGLDTYVIQRSDVITAREHAEELSSQGERKGEYRNGVWFGIKVVSVAHGSIYERMGLQPGDVLVKANEYMLGMPPHEMKAVGLLKTATRIELEIERGGVIIRKTYFIQD